jgi:mono/diheme cytochrome c family protein
MKKVLLAALFLATASSFFSFQSKFDLKASVARGKELYTSYCISCHMEQGEGIENIYPPLAKSDYLMADTKRSIQQIKSGISGEIKVKGVTYNGEMTGFDLSDEEVSDVLNYIRNSWGNKGEAVKPEDVKTAK